jgi:hypothetical protein
MKRGIVIIPESPLAAELGRLEHLKQQARAMLTELENSAGYNASVESGGWRHDPIGWMKRYKR